MREETTESTALMAAYKIVADKAEHLAGTGTFTISAITDWENHRTLAALLASDMDFRAAARRLTTPLATIYRQFRKAAREFRRKCLFRY